MSRRTTIIILIIFLSLVIGGFVGFYFYISSKNGGSESGNSTRSGFFGFFNNGTPQVTPQIATQPESATTTPVSNVQRPIPRLRQIAEVPVSGADFVFKEIFASSTDTNSTSIRRTPPRVVATVEVIRWMERGTGNIFETATSTLNLSRLSNTTITKVQEAIFTDKGSSVLIRTLLNNTADTIQTQFGALQTVSPTSTEQTLKLQELPLNITSLSLSPTKSQLFYILPGNIRGTLSRTDGSSKTTLFDSPFHEWLTDWPNENAIVLNTKPSGSTAGYAYILNPKTKSVIKLIGNKNGLTTLLSPDANRVLYGESIRGSIQLTVFDRKTNASIPLFVKTFPEKCIWSKKETSVLYCAVPTNIPFNTYPDVWYQGLVQFSDSVWKINTTTGETRQILNSLEYTDDSLDMIKPTLDQREDYLMFINKSDLSLWGFQILPPGSTTTNATSAVQ